MSAIEPKTIRLRDGAEILLRSPTEDDAAALIDYLAAVRRQTPYLLFDPQDKLPDLDAERAWIRGGIDDDRAIKIMAMADDQIVGLCDSDTSNHVRARHYANLGISIDAGWHNRGLGTALMRELVAWAKAHPTIDVLALTVFADNARACRVYEKVGFTVEGRRRWSVKRGDRYIDQLCMSMWVGVDRLPITQT